MHRVPPGWFVPTESSKLACLIVIDSSIRSLRWNGLLSSYELIAPHYDERNTRDLVITHRETVLRLKNIRNERSSLRVLDLGGGTGIHIAQAFFDEQNVSWDYVDHSVAMLNQFRQNFVNTPLFPKVRIHLDDMVNVLPRLSSESYDVVLLSLVLSSMPSIPDFGNSPA